MNAYQSRGVFSVTGDGQRRYILLWGMHLQKLLCNVNRGDIIRVSCKAVTFIYRLACFYFNQVMLTAVKQTIVPLLWQLTGHYIA